MNLSTTLLFYLLIGAAVAVAVHQAPQTNGLQRWFRTLSAIFFWPLYLPALLQRTASSPPDAAANPTRPPNEPPNELFTAIQQVEAELDLALRSLDGWSDAVLACEQHRFAELRAAWHAQAGKIRELDRLLSQPAFAEPAASEFAEHSAERAAHSERARRANIARLGAVGRRLHDDLVNTLAWVRELVTMIHLAKYTGAPASRAEELVMQIATSVQGLSEVASWREEESPAAS